MKAYSLEETKSCQESPTRWSTRAKVALLRKMIEIGTEKSVEIPKTHKTLMVILTLFMFPVPQGNCLVGETRTELVARYGSPIATTEENNKSTMTFLKENIFILSEIVDNKRVLEAYLRKINPNMGFSLQEITPILEAHGKILSHWNPQDDGKHIVFFLKEKNLAAIWLKEAGHLIVATQPKYEEWRASQK